MKLTFVEVAGFRGFKQTTRFDFTGGFVVLTGRNGVGKSTVFDAVDFALTGTINKFAVKGAKGGGLDEHIWWVGDGTPDDQRVSVGFVDENGKEVVITRSRERGLATPLDGIARRLWLGEPPVDRWSETLMRTTLIRDETIAALSLDLPEQARFAEVRSAIGGLAGPDHTGRTGAIAQAANSALADQRTRVVEAQAALGSGLSALTEARGAADRQGDVAEAERTIAALFPDLKGVSGDRAVRVRRLIAERKQSIPELAGALARAEGSYAERIHFSSDAGKAEIAAATTERDVAQQAREQASKLLDAAQRVEASERDSQGLTAHLVDLLAHGEAIGLQAGHCPLCDAARTPEEFAEAIASARSKLSARDLRVAHAAAAVEQARGVVVQADTALEQASRRLEAVAARRLELSRAMESLTTTFRRWGLSVLPADLDNTRALLLRREEENAQLEHSLFVLEGSSAHDRAAALETRVEHLRARLDEETAKLTHVEQAVEAARQIDSAAKEVGNQVLAEQFDTVMPLLKELYQRLRPHTDWREIEIDFGGRVRASLNFTVGDGRNPQFLFSSGQRRAAGIAFLLAIHLSRPWCLLRSLMLDDPVQHIDDYRALNLVEVLSAVRRTGRQVIIAVEDPALADVLCRRLRSSAVEEGRRFDLTTARDGSAAIERQVDIYPLPSETLKTAEAS